MKLSKRTGRLLAEVGVALLIGATFLALMQNGDPGKPGAAFVAQRADEVAAPLRHALDPIAKVLADSGTRGGFVGRAHAWRDLAGWTRVALVGKSGGAWHVLKQSGAHNAKPPHFGHAAKLLFAAALKRGRPQILGLVSSAGGSTLTVAVPLAKKRRIALITAPLKVVAASSQNRPAGAAVATLGARFDTNRILASTGALGDPKTTKTANYGGLSVTIAASSQSIPGKAPSLLFPGAAAVLGLIALVVGLKGRRSEGAIGPKHERRLAERGQLAGVESVLFVVRSDGVIETASRGAANALSIERGDLSGEPLAALVAPEDAQTLAALIAPLQEGEDPERSARIGFVTSSGETVPANLTARPQPESAGRTIVVATVMPRPRQVPASPPELPSVPTTHAGEESVTPAA